MAPRQGTGKDELRPLYRREYERLVEADCFRDERLELLSGALLCKEPQGAVHAEVTRRIAERLVIELAGRAQVREHSPFALSEESEPEPDVAVVPRGDYTRGHPTRAFLLVEVADSSLPRDRAVKAALYAEAGVPEYWLVNLADSVVEVHRAPRARRYDEVTHIGPGAIVSPAAFPDIELPAHLLLPQA